MQLNIFDTANSVNACSMNWQEHNSRVQIPGMVYIPEFISESEHKTILSTIDNQPWITDLRRRVQHYGWRYNYKSRSIDYSMYLGELPMWAKSLAQRLFEFNYLPQIPDQIIVNEYQPGQGIANHVDCEPCFADSISSLSLGSNCVMELINLKTKQKVELMLESRSLIIISGESRYKWTHGIPARKSDIITNCKIERSRRVSMTFRNVVLPDNFCFFPKI